MVRVPSAVFVINCLCFNYDLILIRWTDIIMIRTFLRVAEAPDDLLAQLNDYCKWGKSFSSDDIKEITKFYTMMDPLEVLFSSLNSNLISLLLAQSRTKQIWMDQKEERSQSSGNLRVGKAPLIGGL